MNTTKTAQFTPGPWREYHTHGNWEMYGSNGQLLFRIKDGVIPMLNDTALIAAAPAMYDRHKDNHGMVQAALRFLYEGVYEEVKCLLNHIALNSKKAVKQAEGRHHE